MTKLRCWPGCLAVIVRSMAGNEGRVVQVVGDAYVGLSGDLGCEVYAPGVKHWHCRSQAPVPNTYGDGERDFAFPDTWLRAITPPPGTVIEEQGTEQDAPGPVLIPLKVRGETTDA